MRTIVTIQVLKNGYVVSYYKRSKAQELSVNPSLAPYVPTADIFPGSPINATIPPAIEENIIVTTEEEVINILREVKESLNE